MHDKPFDVNSIEDEIQTSVEETYDPVRTGTSVRRTEGRYDPKRTSGSVGALPKDLTEALQAQGSVEKILAARKGTHGDFTDNAATSQALKYIMEQTDGWAGLSAVQAESLHMIAHKIGRILAGNPDHHDHWDDIAGYAKLVSERI